LTVPEDMVLHDDIKILLQQRKRMMESEKGITIAFAEALAFGCLMTRFSPEDAAKKSSSGEALSMLEEMQEHPPVAIRLSGQDSVRGTFNQRHAAIVCQKTSRQYWQLNHLEMQEQASITVCNSNLCEAAILGYEYGYSLSNEMALTLWEAQFGDFANVAQGIIDNFIVSGEDKWSNYSSLVMLLPHGYDGQGPEHSSARLERFLQLVDDDPDEIPGKGIYTIEQMEAGYAMLVAGEQNKNADIGIDKSTLIAAISKHAPNATTERIDVAVAEILSELHGTDKSKKDKRISKDDWCFLMSSWLQRNTEQRHNLCVISPSSPAQYFHALRRQIHRHYAKPLVVMSSKWLLHHKSCTSDLADMGPGTFFQRIIAEGGRGDNMAEKNKKAGLIHAEPQDIKKLIFCCGKIFYHLYHARSASLSSKNSGNGNDNGNGNGHGQVVSDIVFVRLEQIAPFPYDVVGPVIERYPNAQLIWVQEEPKNMGAWGFVKLRFDTIVKDLNAKNEDKRVSLYEITTFFCALELTTVSLCFW
jgi:2-oxoglutarate dehydrogenase complex dehydrogenase (E1) component-like enzyme